LQLQVPAGATRPCIAIVPENIMGRPYGSEDEEAVSRSAIEALARETAHSIDEVRDIYEGEFARLRDGARVHDYLVLFASRRTRDRLVQGRR
jgi:hypothetical protein